MHTESYEFLMKPKESAECHSTLSSQVGSGHKANPVSNHIIFMDFNLLVLRSFGVTTVTNIYIYTSMEICLQSCSYIPYLLLADIDV